MAYCPECGENISDTDTFCPYCGISLQPVVPVAGVPNEPATDATTFSAEESAAEPDNSVPTPADDFSSPAAAQPTFEEGFGANPFAQFESAESETRTTADQINVKTDSEIQLEDAAEPVADSWEMTPVKRDEPAFAPAEESAESRAAEIDPADGESRDAERQVPEPIPESENAAGQFEPLAEEAGDYGEIVDAPARADDHSPPSAEQPPPSANYYNAPTPQTEKAEDDAYNPEFEQTIPYVPSGYLTENKEAQGAQESSLDTEAAATPAPDADGETPKSAGLDPGYMSFSMIPTPNRTEAISMPETPIESAAHDSLEPKLVSVNILPDFNSAAQRKADEEAISNEPATLLGERGAPDAENLAPPSAPESAAPPLESDRVREARSYTSPNFGLTETDGKKSAKLKPLEEGTVLNGRYEIVRKIGGGGMGAVYLASDRNLGGVLRAVKEMVQSYIEDSQQEKAVNDFRRESLLLTSLEHPSIPTIFDYFYDEKECRFYLVMKYISGGDLAAHLKAAPGGRIDEKTVTEWAIQIADVLDYLHNRQPPIVYRDLKPSNVMIDGNSGRVMIIDFGIARWVNKEEKGVTAVGTMGYAPPELFSGNVEPRSDIYSLGSTMFHLTTGADPQSNPLLIFDFHKNPRPRQINSRLSDQIEQILVRAVEYNAEHRFNSAAELREALTVHLENLKRGAVTYGAGESSKPVPVAVSQPVFCGFCGQKILVTDLFCPFCGAQQPNVAAGQSASLRPAFGGAKQTARLLIIGTNELDAPQFQLEKENSLVGRRDPMSNIFPEVDLSKFDPQTKISRRHARIWREGASYMLEDLGSSNGTILMSGARESLRLLPHQPHVLANGDKIRVGDTMLHFFVG